MLRSRRPVVRLSSAVERSQQDAKARGASKQVDEEIAHQRAFLRQMIDLNRNLIFTKDQQGRFVLVNQAVAELFGSTVDAMPGKTLDDFNLDQAQARRLHADDLEVMRTLREKFIAEDRIVDASGRERWFQIVKRPIVDRHGKANMVLGVATDITESKSQQLKIARMGRIHAVLSGINSAIVRIRDRQQLLNEVCRIAVEYGKFGLAWIGVYDPATMDVTPVAWSGLGWEEFNQTKSSARADVPLGQGVVGRAIRERKPEFDNDISINPGVAGKRRQEALQLGYRSLIALPLFAEDAVVGILALFLKEPNFFDDEEIKLLSELADDVSFALQSIAQQEKLEYLSYYDALTGLPNRTLFIDRAGQQMRSRGGEPLMVALILLNLERFRIINETLGQRGGDELLKLVAGRLESAFNGKDYLARIGADGFGVVIRGVRDVANVAHAVENQILNCFRESFKFKEMELRVAAKAGIAMFPTDGEDADTLFKNAEAALRKAKDTGERFLFYTAEMNAQAAQSLSLETRLRKAIEAQQFVLHYQPKVELASGRVCGLEALIRWQDPESGLVAPMQFIPLLEETGLILEVGQWALAQALAQHREWTARGCTVPRIAVNVSAIQLQQRDFVDIVTRIVQQAGGLAHALELEITESLLMKDIDASVLKLSALRELGIHVAMDDFGTGYSSLSYLARLSIDMLKIDRSFISGMTGEGDDTTIVSTIITLAHSLNLRVVAEGVETEEQAQLLRLLKCDEMQGYLFSRPLPAAEVEAKFLGAAAAT